MFIPTLKQPTQYNGFEGVFDNLFSWFSNLFTARVSYPSAEAGEVEVPRVELPRWPFQLVRYNIILY